MNDLLGRLRGIPFLSFEGGKSMSNFSEMLAIYPP